MWLLEVLILIAIAAWEENRLKLVIALILVLKQNYFLISHWVGTVKKKKKKELKYAERIHSSPRVSNRLKTYYKCILICQQFILSIEI